MLPRGYTRMMQSKAAAARASSSISMSLAISATTQRGSAIPGAVSLPPTACSLSRCAAKLRAASKDSGHTRGCTVRFG